MCQRGFVVALVRSVLYDSQESGIVRQVPNSGIKIRMCDVILQVPVHVGSPREMHRRKC